MTKGNKDGTYSGCVLFSFLPCIEWYDTDVNTCRYFDWLFTCIATCKMMQVTWNKMTADQLEYTAFMEFWFCGACKLIASLLWHSEINYETMLNVKFL